MAMKDVGRQLMRRLGPGLYDKDGELHVDVVEVLEHAGIEPSRENQEVLEAVIRAWTTEEHISVDVTDRGVNSDSHIDSQTGLLG